jgi:hypothetical protein
MISGKNQASRFKHQASSIRYQASDHTSRVKQHQASSNAIKRRVSKEKLKLKFF